jgi:asparagine synthase (glutamine-hydrolysing)
MCGIAGIFNLDGQPVHIPQLRRMADLLRHRGPDDEGYALFNTRNGQATHYKGPDSPSELDLPDIRAAEPSNADLGLAERRLAILDLSPSGHTPMRSTDDQLTICFNGEIYNYLELRAELISFGYTFRSTGDTEVLLTAYRQWGERCVERFNGMWAFAIWDGQRRQLFCSRDRFGVKPFYYIKTKTQFAFASEPKALWASGLIAAKPNEIILADFLAGYEASTLDATMFEGIAQLPAGHCLSVTPDEFRIWRYWSLPINTEFGPRTFDMTQAVTLREKLTDAVRLRLRADVPVGTCLSGGLDSSAIVVITNQLLQHDHGIPAHLISSQQKTFTAAYEDPAADERYFAAQIVQQTNAAWHLTFPSAEKLQTELETFIWHHDEPPITTSMYAQWDIMRLAHQHGVKVLLDGQGSDELLAGYLPFDIYLAQALVSGHWYVLWPEVRAIAHVGSRSTTQVLSRLVTRLLPQTWQAWLQKRRPARMLGLDQSVVDGAIARHQANFDTAGQRNLPCHLAQLATYNLPRLLRAEDRNSMAFSIEARTPFLDVRLAEYISQLPANARMRAGWSKYVLRRAMEGVLPAEIVWRRDKKGFVTPEGHWLRQMRPKLKELFWNSPRLSPWLRLEELRHAVDDAQTFNNTTAAAALWRIMTAELWLRMIERYEDIPVLQS